MNSVCERFLGSGRRVCLDHVVVLGERHLSQVLKEYCFRYFNTARPHRELEQRVPTPRVLRRRTDPAGVIAIPVLGGLHHDYRAAACRADGCGSQDSPCCGSRGTNTKRQKAVMLGVYLFTVGSFNHAQTSSGVQVQGHPGEQLPWGYCEVTFAHSS
jgi:hypothetical protein